MGRLPPVVVAGPVAAVVVLDTGMLLVVGTGTAVEEATVLEMAALVVEGVTDVLSTTSIKSAESRAESS
jgi:hypothetical protein